MTRPFQELSQLERDTILRVVDLIQKSGGIGVAEALMAVLRDHLRWSTDGLGYLFQETRDAPDVDRERRTLGLLFLTRQAEEIGPYD